MEDQQFNNQGNILKKVINDLEKRMITSALARTGGNLSRAAKLLGTTTRKLGYRVHKYAIDPDEFRSKKKLIDFYSRMKTKEIGGKRNELR